MLCKPLNDHLFFFFSELIWEPRLRRDDSALQIINVNGDLLWPSRNYEYTRIISWHTCSVIWDWDSLSLCLSLSCHEVRVTVVLGFPHFTSVCSQVNIEHSVSLDKYLLSSQDEKAIGYRFYPSLHCHLEIKFLSNPWIVVLAMISPFPSRMVILHNDLYTVSFTDHLWVWGRFFFDMDDLANLVNEEKIRLNNAGMLN